MSLNKFSYADMFVFLSLSQRIYRLLFFTGHPFYSQAQNICKVNLLVCTIR